MKTSALLLGLALSAATLSPALAATAAKAPKLDGSTASTVANADQTGSAAQPRQICRRQETTGSRTGGERICLTREQWRVVNNGGTVTTYKPARR